MYNPDSKMRPPCRAKNGDRTPACSRPRTRISPHPADPSEESTMLQQFTRKITPAAVVILFSLFAPALRAEVAEPVFNVKTYGATGKKADNAEPAIQKAIDACAKAGGGTVYLPPGDYTSGTLRLRSHVRFYVASGATLFAAEEDPAFDTDGLLVGEDLENI